MIRVLITEDSPVVRGYLQFILNSDPDIKVIGTASDGEEAVKMAQTSKPDIITMDIHMPKMDGFEATRKIMETNPVPIVIVSASWNPEEVEKTFRTMEAGAVAALEKPRGMGHPNFENSSKELIQTVKLMSEVKVIRRWAKHRTTSQVPVQKVPKRVESSKSELDIKLVAMGSSTGGPMVLKEILSNLPKEFPVPIVIVQHIAQGFLQGLGEWLSRTAGFPVHITGDGERVLPGNAYLAPDGYQMGLDRFYRTVLRKDKGELGLCPSVSYLFRSVLEIFGKNSIGVLLTGMGRDGAAELKMMNETGAVTIAQDKESSIVHGMPGEAIKMGGATYVLSPEKIAAKLRNIVKKTEASKDLRLS